MTSSFRKSISIILVLLSSFFAASAQELVAISAIQGEKASSPHENQQVKVRGIVTAQTRNGIFIQTPDDKIDANPLTSEGLWVFLGRDNSFGGAIGDLVEATGTVQEFRAQRESYGFKTTELGKATVKTLSSKNPLPAPIVLTTSDLVSNKLDALEKYEGMRVRVDTLVVVGPTGGRTDDKTGTTTSDGVFFGTLPGVPRPYREAGVEFFAHLAQKLPQTVPYFDTNPEMLRVDSDMQTGAKPIDVTAGAVVKNLTGVMDYGFRRYTLLVDAANPPTVEAMKSYVAVSPAGEREITVGAFNLENFFDDEKNSDIARETMYSKEHFQKRLHKASLAIRKGLAMPDVLGVIEVENLKALKKLAAKINADAVSDGKSDPKYEAFIEDGNDPRGIDSGFLVKTTKVKLIETPMQIGKDELLFKEGAGVQKLFDRPPFMIHVQAVDSKSANPLELWVIVNHFKSYLGIDDPKDGERVRLKRQYEAEWLARFVAELVKKFPEEKLIVCGDFNAYLQNDGYNDLIGTLKGKPDQTVTNPSKIFATGLYNLADFMADPKNKYSYVYDGSMQILDHILINKNLLKWNEGRLKFGYARLNADFPVSYSSDITRPERVSDHDAPVVFLSLDPPGTVPMAVPSGQTVNTPLTKVPGDEPPAPPTPIPTPKP